MKTKEPTFAVQVGEKLLITPKIRNHNRRRYSAQIPTDEPQNAHVFTREVAERLASQIRRSEEEVHRVWKGEPYEMRSVSVIPCTTGKFIHTFI